MRSLNRLDHLTDEDGIAYLTHNESLNPDNLMAPLKAASSTWRISAGPQTARKAPTIADDYAGMRPEPWRSCELCEKHQGNQKIIDELRWVSLG